MTLTIRGSPKRMEMAGSQEQESWESDPGIPFLAAGLRVLRSCGLNKTFLQLTWTAGDCSVNY